MTNAITRSGSVQLRKAVGAQRGGKYVRRELKPGGGYRYIYEETKTKAGAQLVSELKAKHQKKIQELRKKHEKYTPKNDPTGLRKQSVKDDLDRANRLAIAEMGYGQYVAMVKKMGKAQSDSDFEKAVTVIEPIKFARQVISEAEQVKTAEGRLHESIEHSTGYLWQECLEKVFTTGEMPPEGNYPYPRGFYDAESRGSDGSIGDFSEEELLYKTLDLTAIKVYIDLLRRGNTHDVDLLEGIKKVTFNPEYVKKVILSSEEVLNEIRRGIKGHIGRLLAGEGSSRSGYMLSEDSGDLRKGTPPVTRAGSVELKKAVPGGARGGKYTSRKLVGGKWVYTYPEKETKKVMPTAEKMRSRIEDMMSTIEHSAPDAITSEELVTRKEKKLGREIQDWKFRIMSIKERISGGATAQVHKDALEERKIQLKELEDALLKLKKSQFDADDLMKAAGA